MAIVLLEHVLVPRLEPAHYMISEYANSGGLTGVLGRASLAAWGASLVTTAALALVAARSSGGHPTGWRALAVSLLLAGVGLVVSAVCTTQAVRGVVPPGEQVLLVGRLHDLSSGIGQLAIFSAAILSARLFRTHRSFSGATVALVVAGLIVGPGLAVVSAADRGLRQRVLLAGACAWQLGLIRSLERQTRPAGAIPQ